MQFQQHAMTWEAHHQLKAGPAAIAPCVIHLPPAAHPPEPPPREDWPELPTTVSVLKLAFLPCLTSTCRCERPACRLCNGAASLLLALGCALQAFPPTPSVKRLAKCIGPSDCHPHTPMGYLNPRFVGQAPAVAQRCSRKPSKDNISAHRLGIGTYIWTLSARKGNVAGLSPCECQKRCKAARGQSRRHQQKPHLTFKYAYINATITFGRFYHHPHIVGNALNCALSYSAVLSRIHPDAAWHTYTALHCAMQYF